jgi:hypothetical protein
MPELSAARHWWPTPDQRWLLRAALLDGEAALDAWQRWEACVPLDRVDAGSFRLLPLLYRNLSRLGVTSPVMRKLKGVHQHAWFKNQLVIAMVADALSALERAGVQTLVLKGVPLALLYYRDEALRPMADADVLVRPADAAAAGRAMAAAGWISARAWPPLVIASTPFRNAAGRELDLHSHVSHECLSPDADDAFWAASVPLHVRGVATRTLGPADMLLHVLAHGSHWSAVAPLRWAADARVIITGAGRDLDWDRFVEHLEARRLVAFVDGMVEYLRDDLAAPVPDGVVERIRRGRPTRGQRIEHWARARPGMARILTEHWCRYRRLNAQTHRWDGVLGFQHFLRDVWELETAKPFVQVAFEKSRNRLRWLREARATRAQVSSRPGTRGASRPPSSPN